MSIRTSFNPMGTLGGELPPGYESVESVFLPIGTLVRTTHTVSGFDTYTVRAEVTSLPSDLGGFGAYGHYPYSFIAVRSSGGVYAGLGSGYGGTAMLLQDGSHNFIFTPTQCRVDDTVIYAGTQLNSPRAWCLNAFYFCNSYKSVEMVFYGGTLERDGTLIAKWVPCRRKADDTLHIYELGETPGFLQITGPVLPNAEL